MLNIRYDADFLAELQSELKDYVGRPNPLYHAAAIKQSNGWGTNLFKTRRFKSYRCS